MVSQISKLGFSVLVCPGLGKTEVIKKIGHGLHYQTREVYDCVMNGKKESTIVPWSESLNWAATLELLAEKTKT